MAQPETIETKIQYLLSEAAQRDKVPNWPPDIFCLCAAILRDSGAYSCVINDSDLNPIGESAKRAQELRRVGREWAKAVSVDQLPPIEVIDWWNTVFDARRTLLQTLDEETAGPCRRAIIDLLGAADEACAGLGLPLP
jgi:hypothetical protein